MLQQTRVETVIPYYHRFLMKFPDAKSLAAATEDEMLAAWSGLGYYSRARNLRRAATVTANAFPSDFAAIRDLPGVGPYTAAAVASIAFQLPYAAVDGNVLRVIARLTADASDIGAPATRFRFGETAQELLPHDRPGDFNQALMELGATVCLPRAPLCLICPTARDCLSHQQGRQSELPVKRGKGRPDRAEVEVVVARRGDKVLLKRRSPKESRMPGFWELPELTDLPGLRGAAAAGSFRHTIVNTRYDVKVMIAQGARQRSGMKWISAEERERIPVTTITKKAFKIAGGCA